MVLVGDGPETGVNHWDEVLNEGISEALGPILRKIHSERARLSGTHLEFATISPLEVGPGAVVHHNDERKGFTLGNQVVENDACLALLGPAVLALAAAVLEVEYRIAPVKLAVVARRGIDIAVAHCLVVL